MKKLKIKNLIIIILFITILICSAVIIFNKQERVLGKIYFNKPVSWESVYIDILNENDNNSTKSLLGIQMNVEKDYIYSFEITNKMVNANKKFSIIFYNDSSFGETYKVETKFEGFDKIYNITKGIGEENTNTIGEWLDYSDNIKIGKIPNTDKKIKNIIYMIGDGMGENHILAGEIYKGEKLNIQTINNKTYVKTASTSTVTDSAASATALASGYKTINASLGKDKYGDDVENIMEFANTKGLKTGIVCTQIINHATPAGFSVHNPYRYNYEQIAYSQTQSFIDIMLGGGRKYFRSYETELKNNNYKWINNISELKDININNKVIGTFAEESISRENNRISLSKMVEQTIPRLENENGFILMVEGSDIDTYSHESNISKMLVELIDFDEAVKVAKEYVDNHPDTILIVTADHETGGLLLNGVKYKEQLSNNLFTTIGQHTESNVPLYAYGIGAEDLTKYDIIDNTSIYKFLKSGILNNKN